MKRIVLFLATNLAVMLVLGITASLLGVNKFLTANGLNLGALLVFAALMGLSLSSIFLVYTQASIARVFFITAASFGALSLYGYTTSRSLSGMGSFLFMGLIGIIIASLVNLFLQSSALQFAVSVIGVVFGTYALDKIEPIMSML